MNPLVRLYLLCLGWGVGVGMATGAVIAGVYGAWIGDSDLAAFAIPYGLVTGGLFAIVPTALAGLAVLAVVGRRRHPVSRRDLALRTAAVIGVIDVFFALLFRGELVLFAMVNVVAAPMLYLGWRRIAKEAEAVL